MALHVGDEVVMRDMADNAADIRRANALAEEETEIGIAEHFRSYFVRTIDPGIVCRVEDEPSDLVDRKAPAMAIMKNGSGPIRLLARPSDNHTAQRFL